ARSPRERQACCRRRLRTRCCVRGRIRRSNVALSTYRRARSPSGRGSRMKVASATILICTYNRSLLLRDTLGALVKMTIPPRCDVEILVVDNNSADDTPAVVAEIANTAAIPVRYLLETRQGKSFALNRGLAAAAGSIIALTDDDVIPAVDWLDRIVAAF